MFRDSLRLLGSAVLVLTACGGDPAPVDDTPPTTVGQSILTTGVVKIVAEDEGGGFRPAPPMGSTCPPSAARYTLSLATRQLDWTRCVGDNVTPYKQVPGSRTLTDAETATIRTAVAAIKVVKDDGACIADATFLTLTLTTATKEQKYLDQPNYCSRPGSTLLARQDIQGLLDKLNVLAK